MQSGDWVGEISQWFVGHVLEGSWSLGTRTVQRLRKERRCLTGYGGSEGQIDCGILIVPAMVFPTSSHGFPASESVLRY